MSRIRLVAILISLIIISSLSAQPNKPVRYKTMGVDMELLSYGGSFGGFYSFHPSEALGLEMELDWSIVESNDTFTYYNYYSEPVSINNRNLSFVKLLPGVTWFPFTESMHPSMQVGGFVAAGPVWALNTDDDEDFLERWQHVDTSVTPLFRVGVTLKVLTGQGASYQFRLGYDYASFDKVIDSRQTYKGVFFQAGMEFLHR